METTTPKPFVFVLMPFDSAFDDIYQLGIKAACNDAGGYCERVDEQIFHESILERVYNQIAKADVLIADMTGRNPNVFYEVGYAHALGKRVILLTQKSEDIPFDLKHYPHIIYAGRIADLKQELEKRVRWVIEQPKEFLSASSRQVTFFINNQNLHTSPLVEYRESRLPTSYLGFVVGIHNSTEKTIEVAQFQVGLMTPDRIYSFAAYENERTRSDEHFDSKEFKQPDNKKLFVISRFFEILPGSWEKFYIALRVPENAGFQVTDTPEFLIRMFSSAGPQDFPFTVKFLERPLAK